MGVMRILNGTGHTDVVWRVEDAASVAAAEVEFARLGDLGYQAFERRADDGEVGRVATLDPHAEEVFFLRPVVGG